MLETGSARFPALRLALDGFTGLIRGWRFVKGPPEPQRNWEGVATFSSAIVKRPELGAQNENRIHNMRLACAALSGLVLPPGDVLSLQRTIGEPSEARGYRPGPMLAGTSLRSSAGGGLCQVSSVLFNLGLIAGLEILERHSHSSDPWEEKRAFPLGLDATFVYARLDVKLRNAYPFPVQLVMGINDTEDLLQSGFLAPQQPPICQPIKVTVQQRIDPPQESWTAGWRVETLRVDDNGRETFRAISRYAPSPRPGGAR